MLHESATKQLLNNCAIICFAILLGGQCSPILFAVQLVGPT